MDWKSQDMGTGKEQKMNLQFANWYFNQRDNAYLIPKGAVFYPYSKTGYYIVSIVPK